MRRTASALDEPKYRDYGEQNLEFIVISPQCPTGSRWEGDVLEVTTRHLNPEFSTHGIITVTSPAAEIVERFELVSADEVVYCYTITDPAYYSRPWTAEYSLVRTRDQLYEFACHEGNYSLAGMLSGARREQHLAEKAGQ